MHDVLALPATIPAVSPCSLVMHQLKCRYCQNTSVGSISALHYNHGIICCDTTECINKGHRDVNAYFHIFNLALFHDVIKLFPIINLETISVVRTNGSITHGGKVANYNLDKRSFLRKDDSDWYISVIFIAENGIEATKDMPIKYLIHSGVPQVTIDTLIETLNHGIYKNDYDAHIEARNN